jgi:hypothetical protein
MKMWFKKKKRVITEAERREEERLELEQKVIYDLAVPLVTENRFQAQLVKRLQEMFPGCVILKTDPGYQQGIPDLLILWKGHWASLEVKAYKTSPSQPNQEYYVDLMDKMSFSAFIYPENEKEVLDALQQAFEPPRRARVSQS